MTVAPACSCSGERPPAARWCMEASRSSTFCSTYSNCEAFTAPALLASDLTRANSTCRQP